MSFKQYLKELASLESLNSDELIYIMNAVKIDEQQDDEQSRKKFTAVAQTPHLTFIKINRIIDSINEIKHLKGIQLLSKFISILKENGLGQDSEPMAYLLKKYGSQALDIYVSSGDDAPTFIRKGADL